jgi:hypothetical protein
VAGAIELNPMAVGSAPDGLQGFGFTCGGRPCSGFREGRARKSCKARGVSQTMSRRSQYDAGEHFALPLIKANFIQLLLNIETRRWSKKADDGKSPTTSVRGCRGALAGRHKVGPCLHQWATLLKQIGPVVGRFHLVLHGVSQCSFR